MPYATLLYLFLLFIFYFSTMSSFVYLYSLYVHMVKLYLSVFECLLSVFNVNCMHQGSEVMSFQFSVCMYCTCGRIDNKARLDLTSHKQQSLRRPSSSSGIPPLSHSFSKCNTVQISSRASGSSLVQVQQAKFIYHQPLRLNGQAN